MLEALWSVEFSTSMQMAGAGVVVLETNRIFGGDSSYFYIGSYEVKDGTINAEITFKHYNGPLNSVFGPHKEGVVKLSGTIARAGFDLFGSLINNPMAKITTRLTRRAELP